MRSFFYSYPAGKGPGSHDAPVASNRAGRLAVKPIARPDKSSPGQAIYRPRVPQNSVYYLMVEEHFEQLERVWEERY